MFKHKCLRENCGCTKFFLIETREHNNIVKCTKCYTAYELIYKIGDGMFLKEYIAKGE